LAGPSSVYDKRCSVCHQAAGAGQPGVYPKLAGRAGAIAALPQGRKMMISAVLYGMSGKLVANGETIMGVMPPFKDLKDQEVADVLSYISRLGGGKAKAFTAAEVAAERQGPSRTPSQVNALARDPAIAQAAK
jgi:mono/diheme cytochrome c family protein